MKKFLAIFAVITLLLLNTGFAATSFQILVNGNAMKNEGLDITIKAVNADGSIDTKYVGDVLMEINGFPANQFTWPNGGVASFTQADQGVVTFHKGFLFKEEGTATLTVEDVIESNIKGQTDITVKDPNKTSNTKKVIIISPSSNGAETNPNVNVIGSAAQLPNSPLKVFIDGKVNTSSSTNAAGEFSVYANNLSQGIHTLYVTINDANDQVIAQSDEINFSVTSLADELYKSISFDPSNKIEENQVVTVTMITAPEVTTVELIIGENSYFMEKVSSGKYTKKLKFNAKNTYQLDAKLTANGNAKSYSNLEKITVTAAGSSNNNISDNNNNINPVTEENNNTSSVAITSIKSIFQPETKKYLVSWTADGRTQGESEKYLVLVSSNKETIQSAPELIQTTNDKQIIITPPQDSEYYLQIIGADQNSNPIGKASDIVTLMSPSTYKSAAPTCTVDAIKIDSVIIAGKHYIYRQKQDGVDRYMIYRSDTPNSDINQMTKIGETADNKFEFSYNMNATAPEYKYFSVQGICNDGQTKTNVAGSTQVEVGPLNIAIYLCLIASFGYTSYALLRKQG